MEDSTPPDAAASQPDDPQLSGEMRDQLLSLVADRLAAGETLVSDAHFQKVLEEGYQTLVGTPVSVPIREALGRMVAETMVTNPEVFAIPGLENWITKSFLGTVRARKWGVLEMQERGNAAIREFIRQDAVKALLAQLDINPAQLNIRRCLSRVSNQVAGREDPQQQAAATRLSQVMTAARARPASAPVEGPRSYMLEPASEPSPEEAAAREAEQKKVQATLRKEQFGELMAHLDAYVEQGRLSEEDAERLRQLHKVDEAVKTGRVDRDKGSKIRNSILSGQVRDKLEKKVKDTVDYVVLYLQVFRGLQRIDPRYDPSLRYLIRHKGAVNSDEINPEDLAAAVQGLIEDVDTLHLLIAMMDRQDAEVRMMAARLPPYSYILRRTQDRIENLVIEESFVDDLRQLSEGDLSARLHAPEKRIQVRAAADMLCVNALVNRLIRPTPFRKELRLLKVNLILEEFYRTADNVEEARAKA